MPRELRIIRVQITSEAKTGIRKPKKGRARPTSGRTANRRRREMSQARNNARTRERETTESGRKEAQDARRREGETIALRLLATKKFQRTESRCHLFPNVLVHAS